MESNTPTTSPTSAGPLAAPTSPAPSRRRWINILLVLIVFTSGVAIGAAGMLGFVWRQVQNTIHHPELVPQRLAGRLAHRLKLTPEQESRVRDVIASHQTAMQQIRREAQPRVEVELHGVHDEVGAVLDAKQKQEWDRLFSDLLETWVPAVPGAATQPAAKPQ